MNIPARLSCLLLCAIIATPAFTGNGKADNGKATLRVAVAANFRLTAEQINARFSAVTGHAVLLSSASTGTLAAQITRGAPFDVLLAADSARPAQLAARGFAAADSQFCYARGRLVLLGAAPRFSQLADPQYSVAIANAATAPYGAAAAEVLARPEFSAGKGRTLVRGTNILQTYQFYRAGAADLALVARTLAGAEGLPVPQAWHAPIEQHAIALGSARSPATARHYLHFLRSPEVRRLITDAGYDACT